MATVAGKTGTGPARGMARCPAEEATREALSLFFRDSERVLEFVEAYCSGPEPWVAMVDVLGRVVLAEPGADAWSIAAVPGGSGFGHPLTVRRHAHLHQLLDPDGDELAAETLGARDPSDAFELVVARAGLEEMSGHGLDRSELPESGDEVVMGFAGADVSIVVAAVPLRQPHWAGDGVAVVVDQYGSGHHVERDGDAWVTTREPG